MVAKRKPVKEPAWGWGRGVRQVETVTTSAPGAFRLVQDVYVDGEFVGRVVGRTPSPGKAREWDKVVGVEPLDTRALVSLVYPTSDRRAALTALVEATR